MRTVVVTLDDTLEFRLLEAVAMPRPNHWSRVWPSAVALSRWLLAQPAWAAPAQAIELGCGMGLVSLTAAHTGLLVQGTDREPLAVALTLENAARNGVAGVAANRLEWGDAHTLSAPLVLASDVVYEPDSVRALHALVHGGGLLAAGGTFVLAVPDARDELGEDLVQRFLGDGYVHARVALEVAWEGRSEAITLHTLARPALAAAA